MRRLSAILILLMTLAAGLAAIEPAAAQGTRPPFCNAVSLNMYYGYQYNANIRKAWDDLNVQYANVCVMLDTTRSTAGCDVTVQNPWYTAGGLGTAPLCWYGLRTVPVVSQSQSPAGCFPTSMQARRAYSDSAVVRALWDQWLSEVSGVCESTTSRPNNCKYLIEEGGGKYLCFWPNKPNVGLLAAAVDRNGIVDAANAALAIAEVCQLVGSGTVIFEFRIGDQIIQLLVQNCVVQDVQWLTPPENCAGANPYAYVVIPKATVDQFMSDSRGACTMFRQPTQGECNHTIQLTPQLVMCFWGQPNVLTGAFLGTWRFRISMDKSAFRSILNAHDRTDQATTLIKGGQIAINGNSWNDQLVVQSALRLFNDRIDGSTDYTRTEFRSPDGNLGMVLRAPDDRFDVGVDSSNIYLINPDGSKLGAYSPSALRFGIDAEYKTWNDAAPPDVGGEDFFAPFQGLEPGGAMSQPPSAIQRGLAFHEDMEDLTARGVTPVHIDPLSAAFLMLTGQTLDTLTDGDIGSVTPPDLNPPIESVLNDLGPIRLVETLIRPDGTPVLIGPQGPLEEPPAGEAPIESVLGDLSPCRIICSVTPQTDFGGTSGRAYFGGALTGMGARNTLLAQGTVVG